MPKELFPEAVENRCNARQKPGEPRPPRYAAERLLWLVRADGTTSCARMTNVSRDGFGLKVSETLDVGERVILRGGPGDLPAEIRWSEAGRAGGVFLLPDYS